MTSETTNNNATQDAAQAAGDKTLLLIDGHSLAFRAFYAVPTSGFRTSGGQHTNAVFGFISMLVSIVNEEKPTHIAVAFDEGSHTFRTEMFPEYKAQRAPTPEEFRGQVEILRGMLDAIGIITVSRERFEADDIIATWATEATAKGFHTLISTGDRDSYQLVNPSTTVLFPVKGVQTINRMTPEAVFEKYGVTPAQYPDVAALRGDPSDNIPGVPGVGEKTAAKWLNQYGDLENLIAHADEIKGKVGEKFRDAIEQVKHNRVLTQMVTDMDLPYTVEELTFQPTDRAAINAKFDEIELGSRLRGRVFEMLDQQGGAALDEAEDSTAAPVGAQFTLDELPLDKWLAEHAAAGVAIWTEGEATPATASLARLALASGDLHTKVLDPVSMSAADREALRGWIAGGQPLFAHDAKSTCHRLSAFFGEEVKLVGLTHDTMLASFLLQPDQRSYAIADTYLRHMGAELPLPEVPKVVDLLSDLNLEIERTRIQVEAIISMLPVLIEELQATNSYDLYSQLEVPLVPVLARMERLGIAADLAALEAYRDEQLALSQTAEARAKELVNDPELNLASPKQLQVVLFDTLGLPKTKKTKTGYSTAAKEIESLAKEHPHEFLDQLLTYREHQKLKTTVEGLIRAVAADGRIHTTYMQTAAATGRLSSTEPNLQNIPVRTEQGRKIRQAFVAGTEFVGLLTADYSQIEMRVMAHLSQDEGLIHAYNRGEDLHNYVGAQVFDVAESEVTPELRRRVKAMSYGLVYGLSAYGLASQLDISAREASEIMDNYFARFGGVKNYLDDAVAQAREDGYTATVFGRRRYLPELTSFNRIARENAERAALNAPIQGTAADIMKIAMLKVAQALDEGNFKSRMLLQVHDELIIEVAEGEQAAVTELVEREMSHATTLRVPLEVSSGFGANWDAAAH